MSGDDQDVTGRWPAIDGGEDDAEHFPLSPVVDWQRYMVRRMNRQDRLLREIRDLLLVGKLGLRFLQWAGGMALAAWAAYAAWRGIK